MSITDELRDWAERWKSNILLDVADHIDAALKERYIELTKDMDDEYIHIGDELDGYGCPNGGVYCKAIINEVMILVGTKDSDYTTWVMWDATEVRHHKPTLEDVLAEFALEIDPSADIAVTGAETIKKYAAKLQLKEKDL